MSGDWKPGTVARATVRGVGDLLVMRTSGTRGGDDIWLTALHVGGWRSHTHADVTDVRPLVVLDPAELPAQWAQKVRGEAALRHWGNLADDQGLTAVGFALRFLADQIEAQTKPPRIPEPGLWGVVEASHWLPSAARERFVRYPSGWASESESPLRWDDLIDPVLVREGVES